MPPVSSVATELVTSSPSGSFDTCTSPVSRSIVPTVPCCVKNQIRPSQSGMVAIRQSRAGMWAASDHSSCLTSLPSGWTLILRTFFWPVVG